MVNTMVCQMNCLSLMLLLLGCCQGARVLLYPYGHCFNSHLLNMEKMGQLLAQRGHEVSMIVSDAYKGPSIRDAKHDINLVTFPAPENFKPICSYDDMDFILHTPLKIRFNAFIGTAVKYCDSLLESKTTLEFLKKQRYDLLILEAVDPCSRVLADYLDIMFIPLVTTGLGTEGNPRMPSYIPAPVAPFTPHMTFLERVGNFLMKMAFDNLPMLMGFDAQFEELKQKHNINTSISIADTFSRATLKFVNSDFAIDYPSPVEPDTVLVGGFALDPPKPLDGELEEFMDSATDGVIVMSFGTVTKRFNEEWTQKFAEAFGKLPQKVIWKYETDDNSTLLKMPNNTKVVKWFPQTDVLAHPNTKAFITHCGLSSVYEAAYFGVPVVAVPLGADQFHQAAKLTSHAKTGVQLDVYDLTPEKVYRGLMEVMYEQKYKSNAVRVSARMQNSPIIAIEKIAYWTDFVTQHGGAAHLKSNAGKLSLIQYFCLDVIMFLCTVVTVTLVLVTVVTVAVLRFMYCCIRVKKSVSE